MLAQLRVVAIVLLILLAAWAFGEFIHDDPPKQDPCIVNVGGGPGPEFDDICN